MSGKSSKPDDDGIMNPAESGIMKSGIWVRQSCVVVFTKLEKDSRSKMADKIKDS